MANSLYTNPVYFDSTSGASLTGKVVITAVVWVSDSGTNLDIAADDDFLLSDGNGMKIIGKRAESAGDDLYIPFWGGLPVNGVTLTTMDGGVCYVYLK